MGSMTTEHLLQVCPLHSNFRCQFWLVETEARKISGSAGQPSCREPEFPFEWLKRSRTRRWPYADTIFSEQFISDLVMVGLCVITRQKDLWRAQVVDWSPLRSTSLKLTPWLCKGESLSAAPCQNPLPAALFISIKFSHLAWPLISQLIAYINQFLKHNKAFSFG